MLHENDDFDTTQKTCSDRLNEQIDDQQSSGGSDTIVPEVLDDENDDVFVDNKSRRGGKYNLRPNPTPNSMMNTDTRQTLNYSPFLNKYFSRERTNLRTKDIVQIMRMNKHNEIYTKERLLHMYTYSTIIV